jgi:rhodanese-related sulfurtransferase
VPAASAPGSLTLDGGLRPTDDWLMAVDANRKTLEQLLDSARARIYRYQPSEALEAIDDGALLIDIRSDLDRQRDGIVPGSLHIPRTVLEWRLEPDSDWRNPHAGDLDRQIILICDHGCSSVLAAATLVDLGFKHAGDVIGGFAAWRESGLPTTAAPHAAHAAGELAGMRPPDRKRWPHASPPQSDQRGSVSEVPQNPTHF